MVKVDEPYKRFVLEVAEDGVVGAAAERGDLEVTVDGHIAFAPEQYFNPDPVRLMYNTDLDRLGVDYVLAAYEPPHQEGDWYVARVEFDTDVMVFAEGAWKFVFSAPGIKDLGASMTVGRIDMIWRRQPFALSDLLDR
jgi:hypothetical protein